MGKATKWFRNLLGFKKSLPPPVSETPPLLHRDKRRWSFVKSYREKDAAAANSSSYGRKLNQEEEPDGASATNADPNKQSIALAKAAATVFRLTNRSCGEKLAAVKIQSAFRGYLARRALRALKGLVRLQALVRGHIERKRTAQWLRQMQAILRAQARARAGRVQISESSHSLSSSKTSHLHNPVKGPPTPEKFEHVVRTKSGKYEQTSMLKRNGSNSKSNGRNVGYGNNEKDYKTLELDTVKLNSRSKHRNLFHSAHLAYASDNLSYSKESNHTIPSLSSGEVQSLTPFKIAQDIDTFTTAENSPQFYSASSRGGSSKRSPFTSGKSDGSRSYLSGYSDNPSYMAYTESSRAKLRSISAPKQRPQYEKSSSARRFSLQANFVSKAYPGSGRLDKLGMPIGQRYTN